MIIHLFTGLMLGMTAGVAPGPLLTLVVTQTLRYGVREGIKTALAPLITDLPIILAALWMVSRVSGTTWPLGLLSLMGAVYVGYLAWGSLAIKIDRTDAPPSKADSFKKGILVNLLNPHPYLFWLTVGAPMLITAWAAVPIAAILWIIGFYTMLVGAKLVLAVVVGRSRNWLTSRGYIWLNRFLGLALLFFALVIIRDGLVLLGWLGLYAL